MLIILIFIQASSFLSGVNRLEAACIKTYLPELKKLCCIYYLVFMLVTNSSSQVPGHSKSISFYQLNSVHGLSSNYINALSTDKNGNLWVGTDEGLNRFNGKAVVRFFAREYPALANNNIQALVTDQENRIWIQCEGGLITMADEDRRFHQLALYKNSKRLLVKKMLLTETHGVVLFTEQGFYVNTKKGSVAETDSLTIEHFSPLPVAGIETLPAGNFAQIEQYDADRYVFSSGRTFYIVNFKERKMESPFPASELSFLLQWKPGELLVYNKARGKTESINRVTRQVTDPFAETSDPFAKQQTPQVLTARNIDKNIILLTTLRDGIYLFNTENHTLTQYTHRAGDPASIVNDRPAITCQAGNGWVFIGSKLNGISYFKTGAVVGQQSFFSDKQGNSYDNYINSIIAAGNEHYYIGAGNNLLKWNRRTNITEFINYAILDGKPVVNDEGTSLLSFDRLGRLWFITSTKGIVVMDKNHRMIRRIPVDTFSKDGIRASWAEHIIPGPDGWMWIATRRGIRRINPVNFTVDDMQQTAFSSLSAAECNHIFFSTTGDIWVATGGKGLYHYLPGASTLRQFTLNKGGISNIYYCIAGDSAGNIYAGANNGVQIFFPDGKTKNIAQQDGLMNNRVSILMVDNRNRLWIGNVSGIACYNPANGSLKYFDEGYGISNQRLRKWGFLHAADDELFWGTEKGIQFFYPEELLDYSMNFKTMISRIETGRLTAELTQSKIFRLGTGNHTVRFYFNTNDFLPRLRTFYQYKLEGLDKNWQPLTNQHFIQYTSLPPGKYVFKLKASNDNKHWIDSDNEITVHILPPFYKTWWFRLTAIVFLAAAILAYFRRREKSIREKEKAKTELHKLKADKYKHQLETEQITGFFTSTIHQHNNLEDMLWDVAKNLIGKLGFEDCMIYLWNEDKSLLMQKAGYGAKGSMQNEIDQVVYHVPKGKGIVGAAVYSKQYLLVNDTSKDSRYFTADDQIRLSELCVPILYNGETIGAINTEHSEKNFYTEHHVQVLTTIAFLLAEKIEKIEALRLSREKEMEVLRLNKDLATSQLTALRSQMNPHFIFNALNSVQQFILQGNITEANRYLSKFSKLQRQVLNHSNQNFIPLEKELEVLHLYLELEQLRFEQGFSYQVQVSGQVDPDEIKIPPMIIQPFVENSIWHGLMTKQGERQLSLYFEMNGDETLVCTITDNGIGRTAAGRLKGNVNHQYSSKGLSLVFDRLNILSLQFGQAYQAEINDLYDEYGLAEGTEVKLHIYTG